MKSHAYRFTRMFLGLLALIAFLAPPASGTDVETYKVALLPLVLHADPGKAYLRPRLQSMLVSRLSGEDIDLIRNDAVRPLLTEAEKNGIATRERAEALGRTLGATHGRREPARERPRRIPTGHLQPGSRPGVEHVEICAARDRGTRAAEPLALWAAVPGRAA